MSRLMLLPLALLVGGLGVALAWLVYPAWSGDQAERLKVLGAAPSFALIDHLERPTSSDAFDGKVVVASFIYTHCRDFCPLLSARMQALQERLRREGLLGDRVQLLSFTVDPARDTPEVLREYAERHRADPQAWRFLTGPEHEVVPLIVKGFFLGVQPVPVQAESEEGGHHERSSYDVMHSNRIVLIDRQWRVRAYYDGLELDLDQVVQDVRALLG